VRRRDFIKVIAGSAAAWPLAARAQQTERMQHIGVLMNRATDDPEGHARVAAFTQGLQDAGFTVGRDVQIDVRWGADDLERERTAAMELLALAPDIILASGTLSVIHHTSRRCSGFVAAGGPCAEGSGAGDRVHECRIAQPAAPADRGVPRGSEAIRLCRRPERGGRIPLCGGSI